MADNSAGSSNVATSQGSVVDITAQVAAATATATASPLMSATSTPSGEKVESEKSKFPLRFGRKRPHPEENTIGKLTELAGFAKYFEKGYGELLQDIREIIQQKQDLQEKLDNFKKKFAEAAARNDSRLATQASEIERLRFELQGARVQIKDLERAKGIFPAKRAGPFTEDFQNTMRELDIQMTPRRDDDELSVGATRDAHTPAQRVMTKGQKKVAKK
jgi:hypothetical protein